MILTQNRQINQWNITVNPELNQCFYNHLILDKDSKIYAGEKIISLTNGVGVDIQMWKSRTSFLTLTLQENQLKITQILNLRLEILTRLEENISKHFNI
jgi:hypothetical protein